MIALRWVLRLIVAGMSQLAWEYGEIDQLAGRASWPLES